MPCRCDGYEPDPRDLLRNATKREDALTEMLCSTCRHLESQGYDFDLNPQLSKWWDSHKKEDALRQQKELEEARIRHQKELERLRIQEEVTRLLTIPIANLTRNEKKFLVEHGGFSFPKS